ncbi:MAG: YceI family protein [Bacteroidales bacterium]|nr:YceI family protein [Bacteroidales bacterium]
MKKIIYLLALPLFFAACGQAPKTAEEAGEVKQATKEAAVFTVDTEASILKWEGAKITETIHYGTVNISEGSLAFAGNQLEAGSFTVDMNSLVNLDLTEEKGKLKLEGHLKSGDFFQIENYPTAKFEITGAETIVGDESATHRISGNLTIKDVTNGISFPATVIVSESSVEANAKFEINRNEWGVLWGGTKTEQSVKDFLQNNLIKDMITFEVNLKANK